MDDDDYLTEVREKIERHGWICQGVIGAFSYTVGLYRPEFRCHPEFVITVPIRDTTAVALLNLLGKRVAEGETFVPGPVSGVMHGDFPTFLVAVEDSRDTEYPLSVANVLLGGPAGRVPALQLVLADKDRHLPWDPGYGHEGLPQKLLGQPENLLN